ncbi:hypothetical protein [Paenibacillus sp. sgz302251]|uniref:hypothetical protein n=1 Tax=Paenibacillus sp. sgz302251 TaxID=3414493 RepID=UPI003C7B32D8
MNLMELRIPAGFAMYFNKFFDVEPEPDLDTEDFLKNWDYFTEDILHIIKLDYSNGQMCIPTEGEESIIIDLGWYPDSSPEGEYALQIVKDNGYWDVLKEKRTKNRFDIKETLEEWLELLSSNPEWLKK